jgi:PAS domain S-box-containing protein
MAMIKLLIMIGLFFTFPSIAYAQKPLEKISLQLQYLDQFQFAGYYMAKEKGFYKEAGLDVMFKKFDNSIIPTKEVLEGRADYGIGRSSIMIDIAKGKALVPLAAIFQSSPQILLAMEKSHIQTLQDIKGKRVMVTPDSMEGVTLQAMLNSQGIYTKDFEVIEHNYILENLINGKVDLMSAYISNEPFVLEERGIKPIIFHPKAYGFDFYEDILFTTKDEVKNHPQRVDAFLQASLEGWEYAFSHIEESVEVILKKYNEQNKSKEALLYEAYTLKDLAYTSVSKLGEMNQNKWRRIYDIYRVLGFVKEKINLEDLVYQVKKRHFLLTQEEKDYLSRKKEIKMCVNPNWMPYEGIRNKNHVGIGADIIKIIEQKIKTPIVLLPTKSWDESITYARSGRCEVLPIVMETESRREFLSFTRPYATFPFVIATTMDKVFVDDERELDGKKIAIVKNYAIGEILKKRYRDIIFVEVDSIKEALDKVIKGDVFGYIDSVATIREAIKTNHYHNSIKISGKLDVLLKLSIGVNRDDRLLFKTISKALESIDQSKIDDIINMQINTIYHDRLDYNLLWRILILFILIISVMIWAYRKLSITKKKLEESVNNFETLLNSTRDAVVVIDKDLRILLANQSALDIFGYTQEEISSLRVEDFIEPTNIDIVKLIQTYNTNVTFEVELYKKDKTLVPCLASGKNIIYKGKPARVSILTNLTDIKKAQQTLIDLNHSLEERVAQEVEINRQKDKQMLEQSRLAQMGEMISMIAHQWRQPLGAIATTGIDMKMSMMMQKYDLSDTKEREDFERYMQEQIDAIADYVQNLTETIDDFRTFYKPNKERELLTINVPLEKSLGVLKGSFDSYGVVLNKSLQSQKEIALFNNELMQVFLNILKNALDNFKEKGIEHPTIMIESRDIQKGVMLQICDNGGGIPKDIIHHIFNPYFSTKDEKNGTGLGLYMSKTIVEEHHQGRLVVTNRDGGVCFCVEIFT